MPSPHTSRGGKLSSTFDSLASGSARRLHRRPRLPYYVIALLAILSAGLFVAILVEDRQLQTDAMHRDIDSASLQLGTRLSTLSETLSAAARDIGNGSLTEKRFGAIAEDLLTAKKELARIEYVDTRGQLVWPAVVSSVLPGQPATIQAPDDDAKSDPTLKPVLLRVAQGYEPVFMPLPSGPRGAPLVLAVPVYIDHVFSGAVIARIDLIEFIAKGVAEETLDRYRLQISLGERLLASTSSSAPPSDALTYAVGLAPLPADYRLTASAFRLESRITTSALAWVVAGLTISVLVALGTLVRFTSRQQRADRALLAETSLRRAMENSVATGLRVIDPQGVIRYVNRTFCQMTGFVERDLVGCAPPYPYWPPEHRAEYEARLQRALAGKSEPGGFEVVVQRKDGTRFNAGMHESPLLDDSNRYIGWMSSMTDITESTRARNELAAAHERFTTVLESLEPAVSVIIPKPGSHAGSEMVFANRAYLNQFGSDAAAHLRLAAQLRGRDSGEVHDAATDRWFDVRARDIRWPFQDAEGDPNARLQIATDITLRKVTEEIARQQQEKVQFTSRLMTMGEMASSLAHELNQPLTAITNYSEGTLARLKERQISIDELQNALEKTSSQAQRAGGIIRRIREFVKRSEPRRRPTPAQRIVEDAIGFAEIEAGKKGIAIAASIDPTLEPVLVDPLLIEQVLLNLLKNAIDAMEHASVRRIDVVVRRSLLDGMAEFAVIDRGSGIPDEHLPNLFDPFFSTKPEGMGMGLNICRSIVEFHQGRLTVEKNPERAGGTIMRFTLPLAGHQRAEPETAPVTQGEGK
ncbi:MAG: ATP-binding protein [Gemmatimonadota bacterium]